MKTRTRIAKAAAAIAVATAMALLASCSMPVQVPVQTQQQQQNTQTFVDQLRKLVQPQNQASKPTSGEELVADLRAAPQPLPQVNWPALGAGDFVQAQPQWLVGPVKDIQLPRVNWPALGADDFQTVPPAPVAGINPNIVIPELLPSVVWPETAALRPAVIQKAGEDLLDRHPAPMVIQKAGEDLLDRHPANVFPLAPRAVPAGIRPESLEPAGKNELIPVPGPADDCPIRPAAGPC